MRVCRSLPSLTIRTAVYNNEGESNYSLGGMEPEAWGGYKPLATEMVSKPIALANVSVNGMPQQASNRPPKARRNISRANQERRR